MEIFEKFWMAQLALPQLKSLTESPGTGWSQRN